MAGYIPSGVNAQATTRQPIVSVPIGRSGLNSAGVPVQPTNSKVVNPRSRQLTPRKQQ